jgi:preprotein translocase subunit SecG
MLEFILMFLLAATGLFLILVVLIQRGRGGGLSGAFGGMGGQSAFGTKAGDLFTRITIGVAAFWIILCAVSVKLLGTTESKFSSSLGGAATSEEEAPGATGSKSDKEKRDATGQKSSSEGAKANGTESKPAAAEPASPPAETPAAEAPKSDEGK